MVTKMATIVLGGGLVATADLETAVRFALRTGTACRTEDQLHVVGAFRSPYARIIASQVDAERPALDRDVAAMRAAMGDRDEGPATERMPRGWTAVETRAA